MITWDEAKQQQNIAKHGVDFSIAEEVLSGITVTQEDTRANYGEPRYQTLGLVSGRGRHADCAYTTSGC